MQRIIHVVCAGSIALGLLGNIQTALGQEPSTSDVVQQSCSHASAVAQAHNGGPELRRATVAFQECGDRGIEELAALWQRSGLSGADADVLGRVSEKYNDARLFRVALVAAETEAATPELRLAALRVLMSYAQPTRPVAFPRPEVPMVTSYVATGLRPQVLGRKGRNDVPVLLAQAAVTQVVKQRAAEDPSDWVRHVALELLDLLKNPPSGQSE
jgi:hypothetical protein